MEKDELEHNGKNNLYSIQLRHLPRGNNANEKRRTEVYMARVPRDAVSL